MESLDTVIGLAQRALMVTLQISVPLILVALCVGLCVSLFQTVTQIQEQTLAFLPKLLAMATALVILLPWLLSVLTEYAREMLLGIGAV